ncbi:Protein of unknown function [Cotesia congregata]|uniref:Uncharacterized protein n=1 Tax=Cotesia congregata TaxID=51543 RepID=A0A8J2HS17_COTCN|nr:Protein of unknown function [Cotesia congregata]
MLYYLIAFCSIAGLGAHAQNPQLGSCPSIKFSRVDPYQMTGQWFDYGRSNDNPTNGETCGYDHWNPSVNGSSKLVLSAHSAYLGNYGDVVGDISFISDNSYIFSFEIPNVGLISVYHAILEVDYNNFVIYYSCTNQGSS